ncbi:DUF6571 family protein [Streptomyces sp. NBC_01304]|uniref:DUF6571 family protein n=1 Tax=Streptomyces sp. NBC_01304 TaxID=2903818 RepID=UPI002E0E2C3D|nr:hypothetical protein OG430_15315 [Streptomyces sp. NBC_01304]
MKRATAEYQAAADESRRVAKLLRDAHTEFSGYQKKLHDLVADGRTNGLKIDDKGVEDVDSRWNSPTATAAPGFAEERKKAVDDASHTLKTILESITSVDESVSAALRRDANGADNDSFNTKSASSVDEAESTRAAGLARKGDKISNTELNQLNQLLLTNRKDPEFSTGFYKNLGQEKTLGFFANLTSESAEAKDPARLKGVQALQRNLGHTLATATDPDNKTHLSQEWSDGLRKLGTQKFTVSENDGYAYHPYGYQVLGGILRYGEYDSTFLTPIAQHMVSLEAEDPDIWAANAPQGVNEAITSNPSGKGGDGFDPMTGLLEGLGHSPEAAEDFFTGDVVAYDEDGTPKGGDLESHYGDEGKKVDSYLGYFTDSDREWMADTASRDPEDGGKAVVHGPDALGHALEAATTGNAYDYEGKELPKHSAEQAALVKDIVNKFGGEHGGELINGDSGAPLESMRDSLGHITADYMGDFQRAVSGDDDLPVHGASARLPSAATEAFLSQVGQDPDAYKAITASQQAFTQGLVNEAVNGQTDSQVRIETRVENAVHPGSMIAGIMSEARADAVFDTKRAEDDEFNSSAEEVNKWVGRGAGLVTGAVRVPVVGDVAGWAIEDIQESVMESIKQDSTTEAQHDAGEGYANGQQEAVRSAREAAERAGKHGHHNADTIKDIKDAAGKTAGQSHAAGAKWEDSHHG